MQDKVEWVLTTLIIYLYNKGRITTERQVKAFIKKYKNIKRALR